MDGEVLLEDTDTTGIVASSTQTYAQTFTETKRDSEGNILIDGSMEGI
jgi:hypothetical protein